MKIFTFTYFKYLVFLVLGCISSVNAQQFVISDLQKKADLFIGQKEWDSARVYSIRAEQLSRETGNKKGVVYAKLTQLFTSVREDEDDTDIKRQLTVIEQLQKDYSDSYVEAVIQLHLGELEALFEQRVDMAVKHYEIAYNNYFNKNKESYIAAYFYNSYGYALSNNADYEKSALILHEALKLSEKLEPVSKRLLIVFVLNNLAGVHNKLNQNDKAIAYLEQSLPYRKMNGDIKNIALGYCNLTQAYTDGDPEKRIEYLKECMKYSEQTGNFFRIFHSYMAHALVSSDNKDYKTALEYEKKAIDLLEKDNENHSYLPNRYISVARLLTNNIEDENLDEAYENLVKAEKLVTKLKLRQSLPEVYRSYSDYYKKKNDYSNALTSYETFIKYRDSLINEKTKSNIAELETKYETQKKDNEIQKLSSEQRIQKLLIENQNSELFRNKLEVEHKNNELLILSQENELHELRLSKQDEEIELQKLQALADQQKLQLFEQEQLIQERKLKNSKQVQYFTLAFVGILALLGFFLFNRYQLKRTIKEQQKLLEIRENIAKDLHDEIGSTLTGIKILSEVSEKTIHNDKEKVSGFLHQISEQSKKVQQGLSDIIWSVKPENDSLENMIIRMREYVAQTLESKNIHTNLEIENGLQGYHLPQEQRRDFLMIFKEAVNNIAKHSEATSVAIDLFKEDNFIVLKIKDNGKGFDVTQPTNQNGLSNMKSRTDFMNGDFDIDSETGKGTTITLKLKTTS